MAIKDPISAYNAENNAEAHLRCNLLEENGIEAHVTRDESVVGLGPLGMLPGIHKPQIWIDRSNVEAATILLAGYDRERSQRLSEDESAQNVSSAIVATCEDCGKKTPFPASKNGTVQDCGHCGAFIDVGDVPEEFSEGE